VLFSAMVWNGAVPSGLTAQESDMAHFAGLDLSVAETSICIVDEHGKIARERKVPTEPEEIIAALNGPGRRASGSAWKPDRCHNGSTVYWRRLACRSSASRPGTSVRCSKRRSTRPTATMPAASRR